MRKLLMAVVMVGAAQAAQAADLPILRGGFSDGLGSRSVNWDGFYVGGQVQYGSVTSKPSSSINSDLQSTFAPPSGIAYNWVGLGSASDNKVGYGGFVGYNSQWEDVVVGIEGNYIHSGYNARTSSTGYDPVDAIAPASVTQSGALIKSSDFGSLRLRAGYIAGSFLPYVFGGVGMGNQTVVRAVSASPGPLPTPGLWTSDTQDKLVYGYSAGVGVDVMLMSGLFLRAEYEYLRTTATIESVAHSARAGLGYKF